MYVSPLVWGITIAVMVIVLAVDVFVIGRRPHVPTTKEALLAIGVYIAAALAFGAFVHWEWGLKHAADYLGGWIMEYSLSVDNLFIFLLIMSSMKVPEKLQQYALMVGIILALIFRGAFIALGAALIAHFVWTFIVFGLILIYTAIKLFRDSLDGDPHDDDTEGAENALTRFVRKHVPSTPQYHGTTWFARENGKRLMTPMFLVVVALGSTDIMFALDSIPAVFGMTKEPYLVFAATVFALMGLRQLYFLLGTALNKLVYLSLGLAVILAFIGVKLLLEAAHGYHLIDFEVSTPVSLGVVALTLLVTAVASWLKTRKDGQPTE